MQGEVTAFREAVVRVTLVTESGGEVDVEAVVDTGFTEYLDGGPVTITKI
jgi:predicted aspartyl protease